MAVSLNYRELEKRVTDLRKRFLPVRFSRTGIYTEEVEDRARAYRMLIHAELENFFEERVSAIAAKARDSWIKNGKPSITLTCLLAGRSGEKVIGISYETNSKRTSDTIVGDACAKYLQGLKDNNGIRTVNILRMLFQVGVRESDIDAIWLGTIDSFGRKRGDTAHQSAVTHSVDPRDEYTSVKDIMAGIKTIDKILSELDLQIL